jgi:hypothetical protein
MADYITFAVTAWFGLGALFAMVGNGGDDGGDFTLVGQVALFVLVMLLWPLVFVLPAEREGA